MPLGEPCFSRMGPLPRGVELPASMARVVTDSVEGAVVRPVRSLLTASGIALTAVAAIVIVGIVGLSESRLADLFAGDSMPYIVVRAPNAFISEEALATVQNLQGLTAVTGLARASNVAVAADPPIGREPAELTIYGTTQDPLVAAGLNLTAGVPIGANHFESGSRVALVGDAAAARLQLGRLNGLSRVVIGHHTYVVSGIFTATNSLMSLRDAVLIPFGTVSADLGVAGLTEVAVKAEASDMVPALVDRILVRLNPNAPSQFEVDYNVLDTSLARAALNEMRNLGALTLTVGAVVGALIMIGLMTASVLERRTEIGVRRALGATTTELVSQFMLEGALLGVFASSIGSVVGVAVLLLIARGEMGRVVLPDHLITYALVQGLAVGLVASIAPALRASRQDPVVALSE